MAEPAIKLAVIGAGGFVGTHLARLIGDEYRDISVHALDRATFDLTRPDTWRSMPKETNAVVHAAARSSGPVYDIFNANVLNAPFLADFLNERGVRTLVFLSTGGVYGTANGPVSIKSPVAPEGPYATSKFLAERKLGEAFLGRYHVLRLFFPYGPGQALPRLVPRLVDRLKRGETIQCNRDHGPYLSVTHVDDLCRAIVENVLFDASAPRIANLAGPTPVSIRDMVEAMARSLELKPMFDRTGTQPNFVSEPWPNRAFRPFDPVDAVKVGTQ